MTSSTYFDLNRTDYLGHKFRSPTNYTGYYFCETDAILLENLKQGSYLDARKHCEIKTPDICSNKTLREVLNNIVIQAEIRNPYFTGSTFDRGNWDVVMWTGVKRYNQTHFKDSAWLDSQLG